MEDEDPGLVTPTIVGLTHARFPPSSASSEYRGVGADRHATSPGGPGGVAVVSHIPLAPVVRDGVLGPSPSRDADPRATVDATPRALPVGDDRSVEDERVRERALVTLAESAARHGVSLPQPDGSRTPAAPKPHKMRPIPVSLSPASAPLHRRPRDDTTQRAARDGDGDVTRSRERDASKSKSPALVVSDPAASNARVSQLESDLDAMRTAFVRERSALRDVAERVRRRAEEDVAAARVKFDARVRLLEAERDEALAASAEVEARCEALYADEKALCADEKALCAEDARRAREEAADEIAKEREARARERVAARDALEREKAKTALGTAAERESAARAREEWDREREAWDREREAWDREREAWDREREEWDREREAWDRERESLVARVRDAETRREEEREKWSAVRAFQSAAKAATWERKHKDALDAANEMVEVTRAEAKRELESAETAAKIRFDAAEAAAARRRDAWTRERDEMMARWTRERDEMMARWTRERDALRAEAEAERVVAAAALDDVKEAERARADAVSFADARRVEATAARAAAETARADAERAVLRGREEVDAELRLLRDAHETRVRDAARALEEERRRDAETNAHAVAAAEAGVTAALDEARDAVEAARAETRDAAAAFSLTLTLRAWWMSAKHEGERARRDAVAAAANPKRRALKRETLRRWLDASPKPNDARRARRARVNRLRLVAWLAWRREAPAREARARARAETFARARAFVSETRDASRGGSRVDRRDAIRDASTHRARAGVSQDEGASPEGDDRGVARVETRRRRFSTRDGDVRREATGGAVTRHRQDVVHASVLAQTREYPRERREATVLDVQIRANSSGVVRRRAVAVRRSRGDGVVRQTQTSRDAPTMSRRVANARRRGNSRREQRRKGFQTPRDTSRARVRLRLARGGVRARARGATRARVADAKATRRVLGVVRFRTLSRATSAWAEEAAEARRRRVAVRRCVSRRDRRARRRGPSTRGRANAAPRRI